MHSGGCRQQRDPGKVVLWRSMRMRRNENTYYSGISKEGNKKILSVFADATICKNLHSKAKGLDRVVPDIEK